jgi:hypothetical protein
MWHDMLVQAGGGDLNSVPLAMREAVEPVVWNYTPTLETLPPASGVMGRNFSTGFLQQMFNSITWPVSTHVVMIRFLWSDM